MAEVHERFAKALAAVGPIAKAQRNQHHGYAYRGIDDVMDALHSVLADHGLFYVPRCVGEEYDEWKTSKGGRLQVARLAYEFVFYAPDGSSLEVGPVVGQAADTDDKAPMQALSQAAKPALLHAFCIPTEADADSASPVSSAGGREAPQRQTPEPTGIALPLTRVSRIVGVSPEQVAEDAQRRHKHPQANPQQWAALREFTGALELDSEQVKKGLRALYGLNGKRGLSDWGTHEADRLLSALETGGKDTAEAFTDAVVQA